MDQKAQKIRVCIDGNDGVGKDAIINLLEKKYPNAHISNRGIFTTLTDIYPDNHIVSFSKDIIYIILDADVTTCYNRIQARNAKAKSEGKEIKSDKYDEPKNLFKYKNRFIRLAIQYIIPYIDNTNQTIDETLQHVINIIEGHGKNYLLPHPDLVDTSKLPKIIEGCSKIVYDLDDKFNLIEYKPTVYSHKSQREGVINGTDAERMQMTRDIIYLLEQDMIPHAYVYIGRKYILCKKLDTKKDIPNIEVVVKQCYIGSDAYRYYAMKNTLSRFGGPLVDAKNQYPHPIVRFDWRNPNRHPEKGTPMGD